MKGKMTYLMAAIFCVSIMAAGCAKKEVVKGGEEPIAAPPTATEKAAPAAPEKEQTAPDSAGMKEESLQDDMKEAVPAESLQTVYFDFDSFGLSADARDTLKKNAEWMLKNPGTKVQVQGNCDERGSAEYNLALGENRAKAAVKYLTTLGVKADSMSYISFGKEKPVDPASNEAAWAKNRRADFAIIK
jgi:peptidoglycan-associated lipoprotein